MDYTEKNQQKILDEILAAIENVLQKANNSQKANKKGKIQSINIFCMNYYYYTQKEPVLIYVYDDRYYLDRTECFCSLEFDFIFKRYEEDAKEVKKILHKKYLRAGEELIDRYLRKYLLDYFNIVAGIFQKYIVKIEDYIKNYDCLQEDEILITLGGYMDEGIIINKTEREQ